MFFEGAVKDTQTATSPEEFQQSLRPHLNPGKISEKRLLECLEEIFPYGGVIETDKAERKRRAALSQKMQDIMIQYLKDNNKTTVERNKTPRVALDRALAYDTLLNLPHPEQNEEYEYRYKVLTQGTPGQKGWLFMQGLHEAKQGYTPEKLKNLTDEEIAEDFEGLFRLQQYANSAVGLSNHTSLKLTDDQRKELRDFEQELGSLATMVYNRAKMIASPSYALIHPERLQDLEGDGLKVDPMVVGDTAAETEALLRMEKDVRSYQAYCMRSPWSNEIEDRELEGFKSEEVTWLDQDGVELQKGLTSPPVEQLLNGKPLTAVLPTGKAKVFTPAYLGGSNIALNTYPLSVHMDKQIPGELDSLSKGLNKVDHWYTRGSQEFKNVQADLEKMQEEWRALGPNTTQYQRDRLRERMLELDAHCAAYIDNKNRKEKLNDRDKERLAAIKAVSQFAKKQIASLRILENYAERKEKARSEKGTPEERAAFQREVEAMGGLKEGKGTWRSEENQARMSAASQPQQDAKAQAELEKAKANLKKYVTERELTAEDPDLNRAKDKAQYLQKLVSYNNNTIPRSNAAFDVGKMHQDTAGRMARMMNQISFNTPLVGASAQDARTTLAQMILVEMVMKERREVKPDLDTGRIKAGSLESSLGRDIAGKSGETMMLQNIQNSQAFLEMTENLSGKSFRDFFMEDKVQNFSDKVMEELFPHKEQIKAAQEGKFQAPEKEPEKAPEKEPEKAPEKEPEKEPEKSLEEMLKAYKKIKLPRSNASFDVEGLHQDTVGRIALMINQTSDAPLTGASAQDARTAMAQMILVDLVLKERQDDKIDPKTKLIKAGSLESFLGRDIAGKRGVTMMLQNIQNSQVFLEMTENLSGQSFRDFFVENKVQNFSEKVMAELFPHKEQIKAAQEGKFQAPEKEPEKAPEKAPEKSLEEMLKAYKKIKLPRSSERVEGLYQNTVDRITPLLNQTSAEPLTGASAQDVRTAMAQMILVDMVLKERVSNMFDSSKSEMKVGPLESFLDRDIAGKPGMTMMLQNIQNSQGFLEMTENLTGKGFQDFFLESKARNVSGKIMSELFPHKEQIKAAQQPQANKTAVQNAPKEQKKDAAPKMK